MSPSAARRPAFWWTLFALSAGLVLLAVPYANRVQKLLREWWGPSGLRWAMIAVVALAALAGIAALARRGFEPWRAGWTLAVAAALGFLVWRLEVVAEGFHLLQYAVLGAIAFRAFSCHLSNGRVYLAAAALTAALGVVEELVQWITPGRFWDVHDIVLNATGGVIAQLWIALGVRPAGDGESRGRA